LTTTALAPIAAFGQVLATDAATATTSTARCCLCQSTVLHGERYAFLVPNGRTAHLFCIGRMTTVRRRGVPVIR
jgi:hypothetical protein